MIQCIQLKDDSVVIQGKEFDQLCNAQRDLAMMIRERDALFGRTPAAFTEWLEEYATDFPHSERQGVRDALHNAWIAGHNYALKQVTPAQTGGSDNG